MPPRFIALEGIDGSGTTLQTRALAEWLRTRGHEVHETREPSGGPIGRMIREHLALDAAPLSPATFALLFAADRLDHVAREIDPARERGVVLSDRYLLSSLAYQSLDCELAWVQAINREAPPPDLYLFLRVPADVAFARVQRRAAAGAAAVERFDALALQLQIAGRYEAILAGGVSGDLEVVDGTAAPEAVSLALFEACRRRGL